MAPEILLATTVSLAKEAGSLAEELDREASSNPDPK